MSTSALPRRTLGRTDLEVTTLGYGAMEVRGSRIWGGRPIEDKDAETILNAVLDSGINFVDTANDYGRSEEYIGRYICRTGATSTCSRPSAAAPSSTGTTRPTTPRTSGPATTSSGACTRASSG